MNFKKYDASYQARRQAATPFVTFSINNGQIRLNKSAITLIGAPGKFSFIQNNQYSEDWYIIPDEDGLHFKPRKGGNESFVTCTALVRLVLDQFSIKNKLKLPIQKKQIEVELEPGVLVGAWLILTASAKKQSLDEWKQKANTSN